MSVVTYTTFDGELVEENRDGTILDYVPDSLGSIIMWVDETGLPAGYTPYWPYGEPWQEPEVECPFQFVGKYGYYRDLSGTYVRARVYEPEIGRWMTVDPLWPGQSAYRYAAASPTCIVDPFGLAPCFNVDKDCAKFGSPFSSYEGIAKSACEKLLACMKSMKCFLGLVMCISKYHCKPGILTTMKEHCNGDSCVDVWCCKKDCCGCDGTQWAVHHQGTFYYNCGIDLCYNFTTNPSPCAIFLHEISHCAGTDDLDEENQDGCTAQYIERCLLDHVC